MIQIHSIRSMGHAARRLQILAALTLFALVLTALPAAAADGVVNINTASADQLALLPRVGPSIAQRIVDHRDENGEFAGPEDLMLVRGVGEKTFELIEPWVTVKGETTLTSKVSTAEARERIADAPAGDAR